MGCSFGNLPLHYYTTAGIFPQFLQLPEFLQFLMGELKELWELARNFRHAVLGASIVHTDYKLMNDRCK